MILILFSWLIILTILFPLGYEIVKWFTRISAISQEPVSAVHLILTGLIACSSIGTILNYFLPLNEYVFGFILIIAGLIYIREWKNIKPYLLNQKRKISQSSWQVIVCFSCLVIIGLLKAASPSEIYDEGGYFLPYIKWIEQYRLVPGIANIEDRFGFNSSFHLLSALFSFSWIIKGGLYDLNGFLLPVFGCFFLQGFDQVFKGRAQLKLSGFVKILCLFFLLRNMITSPAGDFSAMFFSELICVMLLLRIERNKTGQVDEHFFLLFIYIVFVVTLKLTALFIGLIWILIIASARKRGQTLRWRQRFICALIIILPWMGRFPVLSGYLMYPFYQINVLDVDWKVPESVARKQYYYVSEFAKTNAEPEESEMLAKSRNVIDWFPVWFQRENIFNKAIFIMVILSLIYSAFVFIGRSKFNFKKLTVINKFVFILILNILIWFFKNPAFRFGWAVIIIFIGIVLHKLLNEMVNKRQFARMGLALLVLFVAQNLFKTISEAAPLFSQMIIKPAKGISTEYTTTKTGNIFVNVASGYPCWGTDAPCLHAGSENTIEPRGDRIENGFRSKKSIGRIINLQE